MAGNGALDLSIRIMGKVDPSLAKTISQVKGLAGSLAGEMRGVNSLASTVTNVLGVVGKAGLALGATLTGAVAAGIQKTTNEAVKLEAQMAPVMRYVDGLADSSGKASDQMSENGKTYAQNYANMENYIQRLSMEIPRTTEQLSTMSAALGQSGKDVDEQTTSGILRDTAVAATAMDLEDRTAGDYMAKWEVSFTKKDENGNKVNYSHDDVMRLMNQINYLGANNATTAAEIASSVNKSASVGQLAGVDPSTTAAIATAMQATGVDTERTGTTISRIYTNISKGDSATKAQKEMWATLGFSASGVAKSMQEDGTGTLQKVFAAINQLPDEKKLATLNVLFNQWAVEGAAKVTNNLDLLEKTLSEVSDANYDNYKNSMEREFAINSGTQESLDIMRTNARTVLMQDVGEAFLPAQKELTRIQLDFYKEIDESLPDLSNLVTSVLPLLRNAVNGIGDAAKAALPWIQKGIDYTAEHGPQVAGAITAIVAALGAMSLAPAAYSAGSTLLSTVGNIVIGGKPSGAPGGTFGGITVRNLLGALTPTSLIQKTVSGAAFAGSNAGMFAENAKYGAQMAGIGAQQPTTRLGKIGQTLDGAGVGIWATLKNFKGLRSGTKKGQTGFVNDVLEASTNGGLLGVLKNSGPGKYVTGVGSAISALGNTVIGSGFVKAGGVAKQIATVGVKAVNFIIGALNKIQLKIPETLFGIPVPVIGGKSFGFNLSPVSVPAFANGGMTKGPSIAGEAGTEAVISFRRGVREKNVDTWLTAGKMLGVGLGDLLELPGRKPKMFADGGFTDEGTNLIDFRKAQRQQQLNQIAQSFGTMFPSVAAGMVLGSDAGVAFSRVTEFANYAVDGLEALAAVQAPAVTDDQSKIVQNVNTGIGKVVTGAQTILANENAQKVIQFIRGADVEKAQLEYAANPDHYDLSNVDFFPTVYGTGTTEQDLSMLADLQASRQNVVELPSIGGGNASGGSSGGSGGSGSTSYQRTYTSSSGNTYVYAPNFTVYGGMSADELRELLDEGYEKFCEYMEQYEHETRRKNYGT